MNLSPVLRQYWTNANGQPLVGGQLFSYQAGTTTPQSTYTDQSGVTPNTNPIVLDANGSAAMWLDPSLSYKFVLQDSTGVTQWTVDNVVGILTGNSVNTSALQDNSVTTSKVVDANITKVKLGSDVRDQVLPTKTTTYTMVSEDGILADATLGAFAITLPLAGTIKKPILIKKIDASLNQVTISRQGSDTIDGATSTTMNVPNEGLKLVSDGTSKWYIESRDYPRNFVAYTPTFTGFGTPSNVSIYSRRVGDCLEVMGKFTAGTVSGSTVVQITLGYNGVNASVTVDSTKVATGSALGTWDRNIADSSVVEYAVLVTGGSNYFQIGRRSGTDAPLTPQTASGVTASGEGDYFHAMIPITGWN